MKKSNEMKRLVLGSMPKSKKHWPLAIRFALAVCATLVCCCAGSWLAVPSGLVALHQSKKMEERGVDILE